MQTKSPSTRQLKALIAATALAFASGAMAAESGTGDTGPNNGAASATGATKSGSTSSARGMARKDYSDAMARCKEMKGAERTSCRKDAKMTRNHAMAEGKMGATGHGSANGMMDGGKTGSAAPSAAGSASGSTSSTTAPTKGTTMPSGRPNESKESTKP